MAHIGALKVIEEAGIPIDIVTGTSMGSIIGGLYAIGYDSRRLDSLVRVQDWSFVLSDREDMRQRSLSERKQQNTYLVRRPFNFSKDKRINSEGGFIAGKNLANLFDQLTAHYPDSIDFSQLPIPFACVATNIVDNTEYYFHSGRLAQAMRASMAIPAVFSPVRKDGMVLVDGGLRNNFPVDIAREMGASVVIGVSVQADDHTADDLTSTMSILGQIIDINCKNKFEDNWAMTDVPIHVDTHGYTAASFTANAIDTLIRRGEEATRKQWTRLMELKERIGLTPDFQPDRVARNPLPAISDEAEKNHLTGKASDVTASVGIRFDNEEATSMQIGLASPLLKGHDTDFTLRLGKRIMAKLQLTQLTTNTLHLALAYTFRHNDIDIYHKGSKGYGITYNQSTAALSLIDFNVRNFNVNISSTWDYFHYNDLLMAESTSGKWGTPKNNRYFSYLIKVKYNSENDWYFPKRGAKFYAHYAYRTDNFAQLNDKPGLSDISASWRISFPLSPHFTLQPMLYARTLLGSTTPFGYANFAGGDQFSHYVEQQLPLTGVGHIELLENQLAGAQMKAQLCVGQNNYFMLRTAAVQHSQKLGKLPSDKPILGIQASYAYNTLFGPLGASLGYSNYTSKPYFFINLGYMF